MSLGNVFSLLWSGARGLEVPVSAAVQLQVVPPLERDGEEEGLLLLVVLRVVSDLLVDVLGQVALNRAQTRLAVVKWERPGMVKTVRKMDIE
jgi:hypothetical protein